MVIPCRFQAVAFGSPLIAYPKNRGSGIFIEVNAPLRLLQEGSCPTVTAGLQRYANQSPTAGFGGIYA
jgi:hypothetical protein